MHNPASNPTHFSGSYLPDDVHFLLTRLENADVRGVAEKEAHIQRGGHYSEVLSAESAPSDAYVSLFREQLHTSGSLLAEHIATLARHIAARVPTGPLTLVSLARAGTPVGVVLRRFLEQHGRTVKHYSVSIVRDRGLDLNALRFIRAQHADASIVFVDGWTGKGVIGKELRASVDAFNQANDAAVNPDLFVVADIAGTAAVHATREDYLLPSAILNATVSGLVSRTVMAAQLGPADFHGCLYYANLAEHDCSREFVDALCGYMATMNLTSPTTATAVCERNVNAADLQLTVAKYCASHGLASDNFVKPGVGEATRVMLRRVPRLLVLHDPNDVHVAHLVLLAQQKSVPVEINPLLPCRAMALIEQLD